MDKCLFTLPVIVMIKLMLTTSLGYKRTVLIFYLEKEQTQLLLRAGGSSYAISQLQKASAVPEPPQKIKDCLDYLIKLETGMFGSRLPYGCSIEMAIKWNSLALWKKAADGSGFKEDPLEFGWERVVAAWDKFGFEALRPS